MAANKRVNNNAMMRIHESFQAHRKKVFILSAIFLIFIVVIAVYVWMSSQAWRSVDETSYDQKTTVTILTKDILYSAGISNTERAMKIKQLSEVRVDTMCHVSGLYNWQRSLIGSLNSTMERCESVKDSNTAVVSAANSLQRYSTDEKKVIAQLQNLKPTKESITVSDLQKIADTIQQAKSQLAKESLASDEGKELRSLSVDILTAVAASWSTLVTANEKQDRAVYEAEGAKLAGTYDRFSEISTLSSEQYQKYLNALQNALTSLEK